MPLQFTIDSLENVDEAMRGLYAEHDGKFRLDVDGIEDVSGLKTALEKERNLAKEYKKQKGELDVKYKDIDPDKYRAILAKFDTDEDASLLKDNDIDALINKRTEKVRAELDRQLVESKSQLDTRDARLAKINSRLIGKDVIAACKTLGVYDHAIEDALLRANSMFSVTDDGEVVQLDADGLTVIGKDGKTSFNTTEWLTGLKESGSHWFPNSNSGGGASGSSSTNSGAKTMTRSEFDKLGHLEKAAKIKTHALVD